MDPATLMRLAIEEAKQGIAHGQSPFGCAIALGDRVIACAHNMVLATTDITAHAEVSALRAACRAVNNILLEGALVASTCEPCPMCMSALHWARVDCVYYGATIRDAADAGFNELTLPAADLLHLGGSTVRLIGNVERNACRELFHIWKQRDDRRTY